MFSRVLRSSSSDTNPRPQIDRLSDRQGVIWPDCIALKQRLWSDGASLSCPKASAVSEKILQVAGAAKALPRSLGSSEPDVVWRVCLQWILVFCGVTKQGVLVWGSAIHAEAQPVIAEPCLRHPS